MELTANRKKTQLKRNMCDFEAMLRNTSDLKDILQIIFMYKASEYGQE